MLWAFPEQKTTFLTVNPPESPSHGWPSGSVVSRVGWKQVKLCGGAVLPPVCICTQRPSTGTRLHGLAVVLSGVEGKCIA